MYRLSIHKSESEKAYITERFSPAVTFYYKSTIFSNRLFTAIRGRGLLHLVDAKGEDVREGSLSFNQREHKLI